MKGLLDNLLLTLVAFILGCMLIGRIHFTVVVDGVSHAVVIKEDRK